MDWHPDMPMEYRNKIVTGDARLLAPAIPDESVDLIFTDPVYQNIDDYRWLAETAVRVLKPGGDVLVYLGHYHLALVLQAMTPFLDYRWLLVEKKISSGGLIWSYRLFSHYIPLLWFTKGLPDGNLSRIDFLWSLPNGKAVNHRWSKNRCRIEYWLNVSPTLNRRCSCHSRSNWRSGWENDHGGSCTVRLDDGGMHRALRRLDHVVDPPHRLVALGAILWAIARPSRSGCGVSGND
jgi:ubiquinone/menaquinone biosynthesis C-methylase UbiE